MPYLLRGLFLACLGLAWLGCAHAESPSWYVVHMGDTTVGAVQRERSQQGGNWHYEEAMELVLNRAGASISMGSAVSSIEDASGKLLLMRASQTLSDQSTEVMARVEGDHLLVEQHAGGQVYSQTLKRPDQLLGPVAGMRLMDQKLNQVGDMAGYQSFSPMTGTLASVALELVAIEDELRVIEERTDGVAVLLTHHMDASGQIVRSHMPGPFGDVVTVLADEMAARLASAGGELSDEMFMDTVLAIGRRLPQARSAESLTLALEHRNPALGWPQLQAHNQQVLEQTPERLVVRVERPSAPGPVSLATAGKLADPRFLQANAWLQSDAEDIRQTAAQIIGDETDAWQAALLLERWVAENMSFDMGIVLAPSSEVLSNRRGTCSEYTMLLTALARAAGIPARYVMGYVYAHGMFAGHAWTEVYLDGQWLALDAAIVSNGVADAARLAFQWSDLNDGVGEMNAGPGAQLFGQIRADVLAYQSADRSLDAQALEQIIPRIDETRFVDGGLGVSWTVPEGFRVVDYQRTWPDNLVAALSDGNGNRVELRHMPLSPYLSLLEQANQRLADVGQAALVDAASLQAPGVHYSHQAQSQSLIGKGDALWLVSSTGSAAKALHAEIVGGLHLD